MSIELRRRGSVTSPIGRGRIASSDAIRVRGYALSIDLNPSPQPSKSELRSSRPQAERTLVAFAETSSQRFRVIRRYDLQRLVVIAVTIALGRGEVAVFVIVVLDRYGRLF